MFRIVKQRREVKFPLVYAGMLDHEDSDNITKFQFFNWPPATAPLSRCHIPQQIHVRTSLPFEGKGEKLVFSFPPRKVRL